jgi:hypothetical protein
VLKKMNIALPILLLVFAFTSVNAAETRQGVLNKLNSTLIKKAGSLDGFTMPEILELLSDFSDNKVNFMYMSHLGGNRVVEQPVAPNPAQPIDPATGLPSLLLPQVAANAPPVGLQMPPMPNQLAEVMPRINGVRVKLRNVTLKQLLDITAMSFDRPIEYIVMDYGVIFIPRKKNAPILFNRVYQINPRRLNK